MTPQFAYGHTLLGHEYVMTEELEKALACFRRAVSIDPRHYNAWSVTQGQWRAGECRLGFYNAW